MVFKLIFLSVACLAFLVSPAQSGNIGDIKSAAVGVVSDVASIGTNVVKTKSAAVVQAASDIASIIAGAIGLKVKAIGDAASRMTGAASNGLLGISDSIAKAGSVITKGKLANSNSRFLVERPVEEIVEVKRPRIQEVVEVKRPAVQEFVELRRPVMVEEDIVMPYEKDIVEVRPRVVEVERSPRFNFRSNRISNVWNALRSAKNLSRARSPVVYEFVNKPRMVEALQVQKK